jgi:hypothetical protein
MQQLGKVQKEKDLLEAVLAQTRERDDFRSAKEELAKSHAQSNSVAEDKNIQKNDTAAWKKAAYFGPGGTKQLTIFVECV